MVHGNAQILTRPAFYKLIGIAMDYRITVEKYAKRLQLWSQSALARTYPIVLGRNSAADKAVEGDNATPLGEFYVCAKNPRSKYFLSLCLSYPGAEDAERGMRDGLINAQEHAQILVALQLGRIPPQHTRLGGEIYIHGGGIQGSVESTRGCIALDNASMRDLYDLVGLGTRVSITE
jgi:murein L,D-transpeptidase YafK